MSVEAPASLTTTTPYKLEVLINPDPGGTYEGSFNINDTIIFARSSDRILPPAEPQEIRKTPPLDFEKDFRGIDRVRRFFKEGGVIMPEAILNYNPILARWGFEEAKQDGKVDDFKEHETKQVEKTLRERYNSAQSIVIYTIDENLRFRNDIYPKEPFAEGIQRGVLSLRQQGSPDCEREEKELEGFLKIEKVMTDPETSLNTKMMVMSPPSTLEGSIYKMNFVDFYELVTDEQTGKAVVKMTRFATDATYGDVTDAYLLSHPTGIDPADTRSVQSIFQEKFGRAKDVSEEEYIQTILSNSKERIKFYIDTLCNPSATAESIAVAFQAVLNGADIVGRGFKRIVETVFKGVTRVFNRMPDFRNTREEVEWLGRQRVEQIAAACGTSVGFSIRRLLNGIGSISNFSRIFSGGFSSRSIEGTDYHLGSCVVCKKGNVLVGGCDICTSCEQNL